MTKPISLRQSLNRALFRQLLIGTVAISLVLFGSAYFLGRYKATLELQNEVTSAAKAYRGQLLDGDIEFSELKMRDNLHIGSGELLEVLSPQLKPMNRVNGSRRKSPSGNVDGIAVVSSLGRSIEIAVPIYFDEAREKLFGYLYVSRDVRIDWIFLAAGGFLLLVGYMVTLFGVTRVTKNTLRSLATSLEDWAEDLSRDPKNVSSTALPPFAELLPLTESVRELGAKISRYEFDAADDAKLLILRGIAHDIETPVFQAQMKLATLKRMLNGDSKQLGCVIDAIESVKGLSRIASQVKILRELPSQDDHLNLVSEVQDELKGLAQDVLILEKRIDLTLEIAEANIEASISRPELSRILQNLIHNSAHASNADARITVSIKSEGTSAVLTVKDQGHGIDEELMEKVFSPDVTTKVGVGTGLGLTVVKHISKLRGGSVSLKSRKNVGTSVEIRLPLYARGSVQLGS